MASTLTRQLLHHGRRNIAITTRRLKKDCPPEVSQGCESPPSAPACPPNPDCRACQPTSPNPCMPTCQPDPSGHVKYQILAFFMFLAMGYQIYQVSAHLPEHGDLCCIDYEYMGIRTKRFPWGEGDLTLFHNNKVNCLPASLRDKY